ncbi:toll-like receptor 3 [Amia ocellicauda]|uniref:toll-like receptor 3 n=1 Tax=Amia ocellicauda TaxID=2972642 RepID=UPI0034641306
MLFIELSDMPAGAPKTVKMMYFIFMFGFALITPHHCYTKDKKTGCTVKQQKADCSHLKLTDIPSDLPENITYLDLSHNQLKGLASSNLSRYSQLIYLDVGFNMIKTIEQEMCLRLPHLQTLNLEHNVVHILTETVLQSCTNLTQLNLSNNRLKIKGEPFKSLQHLKKFDVSHNGLTSVKLGTQPQLWGLEELILSGNLISVIKKDDFSYLNNTFLRILKLSSLPLKTLEPGCFQHIGGIQDLVLDGSNLNNPLVVKLCSELTGTGIRNLSLQSTSLSTLLNTTFNGLKSTNLSVMDLSRNQMSTIHDGSFQWLHNLQYLSLEENNLKHLTKDTFLGLGNLIFLNLKKTLMKHKSTPYPIIDNFAFQWLVNLQSLSMESSAFREVKENTFTGLKSLTYLSLSWCSTTLSTITNTTFASLSQSPLKILNLTATDISHLGNGAFSNLRNLSKLYLGHNFISQTLTGSEFEGLNSIEEIYLSFNKQINLTPTSFIHVPTLRTLMLGRTQFGSLDLDPSPFSPLKNLSILDISNNNLANINSGLFSSLQNLKILKLQHNNLARLWKNANPGGPALFLKDLPQLRVLQMDSNGFDEIPSDGFRGLFQLQELDLSLNNLQVFPESVFDDLTSLKVLKLQKNLITSVTEQVFKPAFSHLSTLHLEKNPFDCTCDSIAWFVNWLNLTNTSVPQFDSQYVCKTPSHYFNISITHFDPSPCKNLAPFEAFVFTSSVVLTFMVATLLIHFQGWRIKFFWNVSINRVLGYKEIDLGEKRFEYDAYIINSQDDFEWVENNLIPLEDEHLTFCIEERDFLPGGMQLEAVVDTIPKCKKIVFVVTEALLGDPMCSRFKVQHAIYQIIEKNRDSIVLIFLEDIPDYKLNHFLFIRRGMVKSRCILHWPVHGERVSSFYQQLKVALGSSNKLHR